MESFLRHYFPCLVRHRGKRKVAIKIKIFSCRVYKSNPKQNIRPPPMRQKPSTSPLRALSRTLGVVVSLAQLTPRRAWDAFWLIAEKRVNALADLSTRFKSATPFVFHFHTSLRYASRCVRLARSTCRGGIEELLTAFPKVEQVSICSGVVREAPYSFLRRRVPIGTPTYLKHIKNSIEYPCPDTGI
jgi:hypothetical protein